KALVLSEIKQRQAAVICLVASLKTYSFNWSAWLKLTELLDGESEFLAVGADLPQDIMTKLFYVHGSLEVHRASDNLRVDIDCLETLFPGSTHLKAQHALCEYHMRDFDLAEKHFDELGVQDPFRLDELDTYSNILYVMGKSGKLAQLAQKYAALDPNRPEVCCLIGNLYSLRGEHTKAIQMFRQSLKLDRGYLTAWTLMGHEYVEMSNTHAAIESYRKACQANRKDYRAWYGLGQAYELLGMHAYALQYFQKATALRPFDSRMWQALAQCYQKLAKPHEVLKCFKRAQMLVEATDL
ncbi:TPR-like protein, partial [Cystobasidium minutum MCA 4210]|uniref:TPR-like protein n=1 Tax=Cystobasidium minutum MCA 4210 TaxID=1397322 RepID=UPI0034CFF273